MRSHFGKAQTGRTTCRPRWARGLRHISWLCGLTCEQSALLGPIQGQIEFCQTRCGELAGLPALQDRFDQLRAQEGKTNFLDVQPARRGCLKLLKPAEAAKVPVGAMLPPGGTGIALWEPLGSGTKMVSRGLVWRTRAG